MLIGAPAAAPENNDDDVARRAIERLMPSPCTVGYYSDQESGLFVRGSGELAREQKGILALTGHP